MIYYKTAEEIELIRENCIIVSKTLAYVGSLIKPGITGKFLDKKAEEFVRDQDSIPGFLNYKGFPFTLCFSKNNVIVHGFPDETEIVDGDISLVAIDGYRLAVRSCKIDNIINNAKVIIPGKALNDVNSLLSSEEDVKVGFDEKNAIFIINDTKIITRLLEGDFIDYKKLLPREYNSKVKLKTKELLNSIERASLLSQSEKNNLIKLSIRDNVMAITSNTDKGNVYEEVNLELTGEYLDIAFNSRYFLEGLKNIDSEEIFIEFTTNINPCIIRPADDVKYTYLLLPVRISSNI